MAVHNRSRAKCRPRLPNKTLQYDIPHSFIRLFIPEFDPVSGHRMHANFYKCGDDIQPEHELMWNPITNGNADFHQPEFFGELVLE